MKRLISLLLFLLLCCAVQSNAGMNAYIAGSVESSSGTSGCSALGNTTPNSPTESNSIDYIFGNQITVGASNCKINKVYLYEMNSPNKCSGTKVKIGLYADNGSNLPTGDVLVASGEMTFTDATAWLSAAISETTLTAGTKYWLIVQANAGYCVGYNAGSTPDLSYMSYSSANYSTFPSYTSGGTQDNAILMYVIYE